MVLQVFPTPGRSCNHRDIELPEQLRIAADAGALQDLVARQSPGAQQYLFVGRRF